MSTYEFTLHLRFTDDATGLDERLERLYREGCDDALPGIGRPGWIALAFDRDSDTAWQAITSAIADARRAMPDARLTEVEPDLVGLTDLAEIMGFTRQNMRKLIFGQSSQAPSAVHIGSPSLWHLAPVLEWLREARGYEVEARLIETAVAAMQLNLAIAHADTDPGLRQRVAAALA